MDILRSFCSAPGVELLYLIVGWIVAEGWVRHWRRWRAGRR